MLDIHVRAAPGSDAYRCSRAGFTARNVLYRLFQLGLLCCLLLCMERRAYAYIDPGAGLTALQAASATVFGVLYFLRRRIKRLFKRNE